MSQSTLGRNLIFQYLWSCSRQSICLCCIWMCFSHRIVDSLWSLCACNSCCI